MDENHDLDRQWKAWSGAEPGIGDAQLRKALLDRLPERRPSIRVPLVMAAAVSLAVLFFGLQSTWRPPNREVVDVSEPEVVYDTGDTVILVLRDDGAPIYVVKDVHEMRGGTP